MDKRPGRIVRWWRRTRLRCPWCDVGLVHSAGADGSLVARVCPSGHFFVEFGVFDNEAVDGGGEVLPNFFDVFPEFGSEVVEVEKPDDGVRRKVTL